MWVVVLCGWMAGGPTMGQQVRAQGGLRIIIVRGAGTNNVIQQIPPTPLEVRIENANGPVAGAMVVFTAPEEGPSGEFANDSSVFSLITDIDGLASAEGYHPNAITGSYQIEIRAEFQGQSTTTALEQTNVGTERSRGRLIAILAIVGAAVGAAVAAAFGGGSGSSASGTPAITFGGGAVGAPTQ